MLPDDIKKRREKIAISITGRPSFTWSLASDKYVPPILDPFYKENIEKKKEMNSSYPKLTK